MATMVGKNARVHVWYPGGQTLDLNGCVVNVRSDPLAIDVTSFADAPFVQTLASMPTVELTVRGSSATGVRRTLRETMALAVLDGDEAAARALADLLCEDVSRAASGLPTHEDLLARAEAAEEQVRRLQEQLDDDDPADVPGDWDESDQWNDW